MHYLNMEMVEKVIARLEGYGREVDRDQAIALGESEVGKRQPYWTATEAAEDYRNLIWNAGIVH